LPNAKALVRQRRTAAILPAPVAGGTCNGCYPNTVMSINWRASLVPAAAVIPAPRVYTDIAAVKTLVVDCWVQVCQVAGGWLSQGNLLQSAAGTQPLAVCSCSRSNGGENYPCSKPPSVEADAATCPKHMLTAGARPCAWHPLLATRVHHC